jgi:hypothetical protein
LRREEAISVLKDLLDNCEVGWGNGLRLFFCIALLTAAESILSANDSAVLILTPIVLKIVSCLGIGGKAGLNTSSRQA